MADDRENTTDSEQDPTADATQVVSGERAGDSWSLHKRADGDAAGQSPSDDGSASADAEVSDAADDAGAAAPTSVYQQSADATSGGHQSGGHQSGGYQSGGYQPGGYGSTPSSGAQPTTAYSQTPSTPYPSTGGYQATQQGYQGQQQGYPGQQAYPSSGYQQSGPPSGGYQAAPAYASGGSYASPYPQQQIIVQAVPLNRRAIIGGMLLLLSGIAAAISIFVPFFDSSVVRGGESFALVDAFEGRGFGPAIVVVCCAIGMGLLSLIGALIALSFDGAAGGAFGLIGFLGGVAAIVIIFIWASGADVFEHAGAGFWLLGVGAVIGLVGTIVSFTRH